ncbi:uncharacterized protein [Aristolochia californica]|uniref:uncharacterized protein n=1 Tax=Aristolochia californica TaxID=171875 RepID=UPI0035D5CB7C
MSNFQVFVSETGAKAIDEFEFRLRPTLDFRGDRCHVSGASDVQKKISERLRSEESECRNETSGDQLQISKVDGIKFDGDVGDEGVKKRNEGHKQQGKRDGNCEDEASGVPEISKAGLIQVDGGDREKEEKVEEENDGFRTPTSLERKISAIQRCPPAPRKPRSAPSIKRSRAHSTCCRVRIDVSDHLESLFQPVLSDRSGSIKKARKSKIE